MEVDRRLTHLRVLLAGIIDMMWYLGERVHHWWDGPYMRRVLVTPLGNIFWGREFTGEELIAAERGYPSEDLLEGVNFSYVDTLIP